jgi:hypothetical protein
MPSRIVGVTPTVVKSWSLPERLGAVKLSHRMIETVICKLWDLGDKRLRARHYSTMWPLPCVRCHRKLVVTHKLWQRISAGDNITLICDQCSLVADTNSN